MLIADWLKSKTDQKWLLTPEMKAHDKIRQDDIFFKNSPHLNRAVKGTNNDENGQF